MKKAVIIADGATVPIKKSPNDEIVELFTFGRACNIRIQIDAIRANLLQDIPDRMDDLIRISSIIYSADNRVKRGSDKDIFSRDWSRNFRLFIPVRDYAFWNDDQVKEQLSKTLGFLTEDNWNFNFSNYSPKIHTQKFIFKKSVGTIAEVDTIIPFSGGVDSLGAVLDAIKQGKKPILISQRAAPVVGSRQKNLVNLLRDKFPQWHFPHISMWVNRKGGLRTRENTQRSRSFLYASLSVVVANILKIDHIKLCDNGIVSINLPQSSQTLGAFASRSTHPKFIELLEILYRNMLSQKQFSIINELLFNTKKDVMEKIKSSGVPHLLQETNSCSHVEGMTSYQPHCGVCSQCIDRRFASISADMSDFDLPERYVTDIFCDDLKEGNDRTYAENYIRFALKLSKIDSVGTFYIKFPELIDCLPSNSSELEKFATNIWKLFKRQEKMVNDVIAGQIKNHASDLVQGKLPPNSLIRMVVTGKHLEDLKGSYVTRIRKLLSISLPPAFQTQNAKNERHVQDVAEGLFIAAKESIERESPQIPFATVSTKPDFSSNGSHNPCLFLEFKFIKERKRLNSIITEMTSRVLIYRDQGAWVLFVVYDPERTVVDDRKFSRGFEKHEGIFVSLIR